MPEIVSNLILILTLKRRRKCGYLIHTLPETYNCFSLIIENFDYLQMIFSAMNYSALAAEMGEKHET